MIDTNLRFLFYFFIICIVSLALIFPSSSECAIQGLYKASDLIPQAKFLRQYSKFPTATAMAYLSAVFFAHVLALNVICSKGVLMRGVKLICLQGRIRCLIYSIGGVFIYWIFIFNVVGDGMGVKNKWFLNNISESRFYLAYWCVAIYLIISSVIVFIFFIFFLFFA